jgi:hypothetical protein
LPRSSLVVGKAQKSHGASSGLYGGCSNGVPPISVSASIATFQSRNADAPLRLLRHPKTGSFKTTITPFSRSGCSVVRSASLAKGGTLKKRPSPHLHKVPTRSNKVSPRTLQTPLIYSYSCVYVYPVLILLLLRTKVICACQACQSGHCTAHYANGIYWRPFRHLSVLCLTATKFQPLYFLCWASFFVHVSNIYIIVSLYDLCLLPTYFCYVIGNVRNLERQM